MWWDDKDADQPDHNQTDDDFVKGIDDAAEAWGNEDANDDDVDVKGMEQAVEA
jgi:hypothetical protein